MHFGSLILWLVVVAALCVLINCQEDEEVDRRDVHRIILKPEKSKKHKKRAKAPKTTTTSRPLRPSQSYTSVEDVYEPTAHASSTRYQKRQRPQYPNHHDEYRDLINPRPPRFEDATLYSYPEEEDRYPETAASYQESYAPVSQNSGGKLNANGETQAGDFVDWNPIPSTQLTHDDYLPPATPIATTKHAKRGKQARRTTTRPSAVIFMTSTTYAPPLQTTTTSRTLTYRERFSAPAPQAPVTKPRPQSQQIKGKTPLHQQHHYVNYNHNNKSHIRYEVSESARSKGAALPVPLTPRYTNTPTHVQPVTTSSFIQPIFQTIHHNQDAKSSISNVDNSYEVFERAKDYNKQIKQTSFKGTLVPQPVYPQLHPFLPTVSTYSMLAKSTKPSPVASQLHFAKKPQQPQPWVSANFT